jgi:hypothetical protein
MDIITKQQAIAAGSRHFYTGKPCKYGHLAARYVLNGACMECLHPKLPEKSTALVISTPGEIIPAERYGMTPERIEIQRGKLDIEFRKIELQKQRVQLEAQKLLMRAEDRHQQGERRQRRDLVKSKLVDVSLYVHPSDHSSVSLMNWGFAAMRDPRLKIEDLAVRQVSAENRFVFRCFPEDKAEILRAGGELWDAHHRHLNDEVKERKLAIAAELERAALDNGQPEDDPR